MTGPEHYREAERLAAQAGTWMRKAHLPGGERIALRRADLAAAQVHATLALVAATAARTAVIAGVNDGRAEHDITVLCATTGAQHPGGGGAGA